MRINSINNKFNSIKFTNAYSSKQQEDLKKLRQEVDKLHNRENGKKVFKYYLPATPTKKEYDTGIGKLQSREFEKVCEMASVYYGATHFKLMPIGQLTDKQTYNDTHKPSAYLRSAFTIGEDLINPMVLTTAEYGNILPEVNAVEFIQKARLKSKENVKNNADNNDEIIKSETRINFDSTLGWKNQEDYPINDILKIAFKNFKENTAPNYQLKCLKKEFEQFKNQKEPVDYDDIYTRIALFPYLKDLGTAKVDFFKGFDSNEEIRKQKMPQYEEYKKQYANEIEFFKFKQFLARKAVQAGVNTIHNYGMKAQIDCEYGNSWVEEEVFPDAFTTDEYGRKPKIRNWDFAVLNQERLTYDKTNQSPERKFLAAKIAHNLSLFDSIRFDVGWAYIRPAWHFDDYKPMERIDAGDRIIKFIEQTAKKVKGEDYDLTNLMYECDADGEDFNLWNNANIIKNMGGLAILSTEHENNEGPGWGNYAFLTQNIGLRPSDMSLGTNNHDLEGVINCGFNNIKSSMQIGGIMRTFNMPNDSWNLLKDDQNINEHLRKYTRARFAEIDKAKNQFILYTDFFGRGNIEKRIGEKVDYHTGKSSDPNFDKDYKTRMERKFENHAHKAWQNGLGYNWADIALMRAKLDGEYEANKELFDKVEKYALYLKAKGGIKTKEDADNSPYANIKIEDMTLDEIKKLDTVV